MSLADARGPARPAAFAGSWYPRDAPSLAETVDRYLVPGEPSFTRIVALIAPHAGLMYSGPVAGRGYATLRESLTSAAGAGADDGRVAVLVGPSHAVAFDGVAIYPDGSFETPLGALPIDATVAERLMARGGVVHADRAVHAREHSLELQLPFLARVLPGVPIVPLLMGVQSRAVASGLASDLSAVLGDRRPLLVASSDLSHYHARPTAAELDAVVLEHVARFDAEGLQSALERYPAHACGGGPMVAVMRAARALGATASHVLEYADSGDVSGDVERVVGYLSAVIGGTAEGRS